MKQGSVTFVALLKLLALLPLPTIGASLYDELGVKSTATYEGIVSAYHQLKASTDNGKKYDPDEIKKFIEVQHAYHVLSDTLRRRDYDIFGIDELKDEVARFKEQSDKSHGQLLLYEPTDTGYVLNSTTVSLTLANFGALVLESSDTWIIQVYSHASVESHTFAPVWERVAELLEGVAKVGRVELGEIPLAIRLAERNWVNGQPLFRKGLPFIVAFSSSCNKLDCVIRYWEEKTVDEITDWVATRILKLPRILYYSHKTLMTEIIQKPGPHKVKVIIFSRTGERAAPFVRKVARYYQEYLVFAMVLWRETEATFWSARIGVDSAPAIVFLKDPGLLPVVYHGVYTAAEINEVVEQHKTHDLPQLRSITAADLGCDSAGYSRAGNVIRTWYCVIAAGKPGFALNQLRGVVRNVQENLKTAVQGEGEVAMSVAAMAFAEKRLSLAWLDGEAQKDFCYFYLNSETVYESCGPKKYGDIDDVPKVFLVRYLRELNAQDDSQPKTRWLPKSVYEKMAEEDSKFAAQLVSRYNGSTEVAEIVTWMSELIREGDTKDLPSFKGKTPVLVPEESPPMFGRTQEFVADKKERLIESSRGFMFRLADFKQDPKFFPLVGFIILFYGTTCFFRVKQQRKLAGQVARDSIPTRAVIEDSVVTNETAVDGNSVFLDDTFPGSEISDGLRRRKDISQ